MQLASEAPNTSAVAQHQAPTQAAQEDQKSARPLLLIASAIIFQATSAADLSNIAAPEEGESDSAAEARTECAHVGWRRQRCPARETLNCAALCTQDMRCAQWKGSAHSSSRIARRLAVG